MSKGLPNAMSLAVTLLVLSFIMASSPALGGGKKSPPDTIAVAGAIAGARANADASARATVDNRVLATGGTGGTASQGQIQGNVGLGSGNKTVVIVGGDDIDPPAYAPSLGALANGPCTGKSGGVSLGILGAASLGAQYADEDEECTLRYNIALLHELGMTKLAIEMTNDLRGVKEAMERLVKNKAAAAGGNVTAVDVDGTEIDVAAVTAKSGKFSPDGFEYRADAPYWCGGKKTSGISGSDLKACFGKEPKPNLLARVFSLQ